VRERDLKARAAQLEASERELEARPAAPEPPEPEPTPESAPESAVPARAGAWNLEDLQRLVDAETGATPQQAQEWRTYLFLLREHATHDGTLPGSLDGLINDIFADLVDRLPPP
jgi:hypothetical protein